MKIADPVLSSNENSAFITRWAPDYNKIPYVIITDVLGLKKTSSGEYESSNFANVRKIGYNLVNGFGYVGSQEFVSPNKSTVISLDASRQSAQVDDIEEFSGRLVDSYGRGLANQQISILDADFGTDELLVTTSTDNDGRFEVSWIAEDGGMLDSTLDVYVMYQGNSMYDETKSQELSLDVSGSVNEPTLERTVLTMSSKGASFSIRDTVIFDGQLRDENGIGIRNALITIKDSTPLLPDAFMSSGHTDSNGIYRIEWQATNNDLDGIADSYAVFEGDSSYEKSISKVVKISINAVQSFPITDSTSITFFASATNAYEGDDITFSGKLIDQNRNPVPNMPITIKDSDPVFDDDVMATGVTDSDGRYGILWEASINDSDGVADSYAEFAGYDSLTKSVSDIVQITVNKKQELPPHEPQYQTTEITIEVSSQTVDEGDTITISGQLTSANGDKVSNALISIRDEDTFSGNDLLGSVYTDSNGWYSFDWEAHPTDPLDNVAEIYVIFEGSQDYSRALSVIANVQVS